MNIKILTSGLEFLFDNKKIFVDKNLINNIESYQTKTVFNLIPDFHLKGIIDLNCVLTKETILKLTKNGYYFKYAYINYIDEI